MKKLNVWLKVLTNKINTVLLHPVNKHISTYSNKWDEKIYTKFVYIYIYIGSISSLIHISLNIIDIFLSTHFFVNPFELPYWSYDIWLELDDKSSIISYFPSTFCTALGHHQRRMYYKSDVTFVCTLHGGKPQPMCYACQTKYIVKHFFIKCTNLAHIRKTFYSENNMKELK